MIEITKKNFKQGKVTFKINKFEYDYVCKNVGESGNKSSIQKQIINTYLIVKLYQKLYRTNGYIAIHSSVFKESISSHNYKKHLDYLMFENIIEYTSGEREKYVADGKIQFKSTTKRYRTLTMAFQGQKNIFDDSSKEVEVVLGLSNDVYATLRNANEFIVNMDMEQKEQKNRKRLDEIAENNFHEMQSSMLLVKLIKDVYSGKINARTTWSRRIHQIAVEVQLANNNSSGEIKLIESSIELLAIKIIKNIYEIRNKKRDKIEQIVESFLLQENRNQIVKYNEKLTRQSRDMKLGYYSDLSLGIDGLNLCYCMADLKHIARINQIPTFKNDGKLYSSLANLRRDIRKFVYYKDEQIEEVSDITSAHFTMLPRIFEKCDIAIPAAELQSYKQITQNGDLYSDVARFGEFGRSEIKESFQSFFSIKNEKQYLHHTNEDWIYRKTICNYFASHYPAIYQSLLQFHDNNDCTIKSVANVVESEIMNPICDMIRCEGLHPFRIHDAIYMTKTEFEKSSVDIKGLVFHSINYPNIRPLF